MISQVGVDPVVSEDGRTWADWMLDHHWTVYADKDGKFRPSVVTLCGSTRFAQEFFEWGKRMTLKGHIVLSVEVTTTQSERDDPQFADPETKEMLDLLHFEKIKMSDWIFVINKGGYIGYSTGREIEFARSLGKGVEYLEDPR